MPFDAANFNKPQVDEVTQIILDAREELHNAPCLYKETNFDANGTCILIAMDCDYGRVYTRSQKAALFAVARQLGYRANRVMQAQDRIVAFNDHPSTTVEDVLALLDRAAKAGA